MKKRLLIRLCLLLCLFSGLGAYAQLDPFTLTVTPAPQTCLGNGSLTFTVAGTETGSTMAYEVFLLPNTTTPVATVSTNTVNSLVAGNYLVIATQSLGAQSNTAQANATILNQVQALTYTIVPSNVRCPGDGSLMINVNTGTAATYEIVAGPATVPAQASNQFTNLSVGTYQVKVVDVCGNAVVTTVQLTQIPTSVLIDPPTFPPGPLPSCTTITVDHFFATVAGNQIFYPLTFQYTVFPPGGGAPIVVTQTVATGNNDVNHIISTLPFYHDQEYTYNVKVTDACGNIYVRNNNVIDKAFDFELAPITESCGNYFFRITPRIYRAPYVVTFLSAPAGFTPANFSPTHPNQSGLTTDYGSDANPVPFGNYEIQITDACGHTVVHEIEIIDVVNPAAASSINPETCMGQVAITVDPRQAVVVRITEAPQDYIDQVPGGLPDDVSEFIFPAPTGFVQGNLPLGDYTYVVTDECGNDHTLEVSVEPSGDDLLLNDAQRPGCAEGQGSIRLSADQNDLISVTITAGPPGFAVPADVSLNINAADGDLYMNSLPAGSYTFVTEDNCGTERTKTLSIQGYQELNNTVNVVANCGSFNIQLQHSSNGNNLQSFWLQKYNEATGTWGHPQTGAAYTAGTLPNNTNSVFLNNNTTNINLAYTGEFRVLKVFHVYSNGSASNFRCIREIHSFSFEGVPVINSAFSFPCAGNTSEVIIDADGVAPLTYKITTKDGEPFVVNNGTSNLFSGLEPGTYTFVVTDVCGNSQNIQVDINTLDPIEIEAEGFCEGQDSTLSVQNFSFLEYSWYKEGAPGTILSTTNVLEFPDFDPADAGLYHVIITSTNPGSCIDQTLDYTIEPNAVANAGNNNNISICNDGAALNLENYLSNPHDAGGTWADASGTGALTGTTFATAGIAQGTYQFTYTVTSACGVDDVATISIQLKNRPGAPVINPVAGVCEGADIQFNTAAVPGATYQWTGPAGFTSTAQNPVRNDVTAAHSGNYTLVVTVNGCASPASTVAVTVGAVPNAGDDDSISLCNDGTAVNLEDYLSTPHDAGGTWTDVDGSGALAGSTFNIAGVAAGTYNFIYKVSGCGPDDEATITIELKDIPDAPVIAPVAPACEGNDVQLLVTAVTGATYQWTGPNNFTSTEQNPVLAASVPADSGTYTLIITVNGCASPASTVDVDVDPAPNAGNDNNAIVCNDSQEIDLEDYLGMPHDAGGTWADVGGSGALTGSTFDTAGIAAGTYQFTYTVSGCGPDDVATITISLNDMPNAPVVASVAPVCAGSDIQLSADAVPGATYAWTGPNGFAADIQNPVVPNAGVAATGNYSLVVTVNGCASPASVVNAVVNPIPAFAIDGNTVICEGQSSVLSVVPGNFDSYAWYKDGVLLADVNDSDIEVFEPGVYSVEVESNGCTASGGVEVEINTNAFTLQLETGCLDFNYVISIVNINEIPGASFAWSGPGGYTWNEEAADITNLPEGEYSVVVTNAEGCSAEASVIVENTQCFIPRGISPNDDEYNQSFDLSNLDVRELMIFNRYGIKVYEKENYKDEWHGQSPEGELPTGTYFYMLTLSEGKQVTGWVYLQREVN